MPEENDQIVFLPGFNPQEIYQFAEEHELQLVRDEPAHTDDDYDEAVWVTSNHKVAIHLGHNSKLDVSYLWIHGYGIRPWQVGIGSRFLVLPLHLAIDQVRKAESNLSAESAVTRLGFHQDFNDDALNCLSELLTRTTPLTVRIAAIIAIGMQGPQMTPYLERAAISDPELRECVKRMLSQYGP